jgi:hypothetical protein
MVKAFIGLLIILFPLRVFCVLSRMVEEGFSFHLVTTGTISVAVHLAIILGWYKLKSLVFPDSLRCSACGGHIPLSGRQKCRRCGFRWEGHYFDKCPNCEGVPSLIQCPHCELSSKRPWWYEYWHRLN